MFSNFSQGTQMIMLGKNQNLRLFFVSGQRSMALEEATSLAGARNLEIKRIVLMEEIQFEMLLLINLDVLLNLSRRVISIQSPNSAFKLFRDELIYVSLQLILMLLVNKVWSILLEIRFNYFYRNIKYGLQWKLLFLL